MTSTINPLAERFGDAADAYERGRPSYPPEAVAAIAAFLGLAPGSRVLDLGAGTGKLTRLLVPTGADVVAVEPVDGMRRRLEASVPGVEALAGAAEAIPLPNGSVQGATVAQAMHWFDPAPALSELHRVIAPAGGLAVIFNRRDESVPWVARMTDVLEEGTGGESPVETLGWRGKLARSALFGPAEELAFSHAHTVTVDGVIDRVASISTVADMEPVAREALFDRIRALLADDPDTAGREVIDLPYRTALLLLPRRSPVPGTDGLVVSVNANAGGVPKPPIDGTWIRRLGLEGDGHHDTVNHGGERGAVCLYAQEAIERVRADGHQAFPGSYGENLTLLGIEWGALRAGMRLAVGDVQEGPLLELTQYATPCQTQAHWFTEARIGRISHTAHPEDARFYARVLREGPVAPGDPVRVLGAAH